MRLVSVREPHPSVVAAVEALKLLGFNPALMGGEAHNLQAQERLRDEDRALLHQALLGVNSHYFKRLARSGDAYVSKGEFEAWLAVQDDASLAHTLKILGVLCQSKAYLYWCGDRVE
jgi:hypothetical protein